MVKAISKSETQKKGWILPEKYHHIIAVLIILLSIIVFFWGIIFENNTFIAADTVASRAFETLKKDAESQGIFPLWNPYIFCGMPGYASLSFCGNRYFDITDALVNYIRTYFSIIFLNNCDVGYVLFYYFLLGVGVYFLIYRKLNNRIAALISALAVTHSTAYVVFVMIGHMTKIPVFAFFPYILMIVQELEKKFRLWLAILLAVAIHLMIKPSHLQIIFYIYFTLGIYYIFFIVRSLIRKESIAGLIRSGVTLLVASVFALGMTADQYWQTYEYSKYSIRGTSPILERVDKEKQAKSDSEGGLDYDYATSWSFAPSEMLTFLIPSAYGFGWHHYKGFLTRNQSLRINTYIGSQPFVDSPQYMGIIVLLLGILGFWKYRKDAFVQFMGIIIVIALLLSFGREFAVLYNLMFYYFPMFNKFRVPSMILILVQFFIPVLAGYGLHWLLDEAFLLPEDRKKKWFRVGLVSGALAVLTLVFRDIFIGIYQIFVSKQSAMNALARSFGTNTLVLDEIYKVITQMVVTDIFMGFLLITATIFSIYLFWRKKVSATFITCVLIVIILTDLWRVNNKPKEMHPKQRLEETFVAPDYIRFLKNADTTLFRVLEFEDGHPPYNNTLAYWRIQNAYGYHGAKMRQIQDVFDVVGLWNPLLWGLMDVKYIISNRPDSNQILIPLFKGNRFVYYNRAHLPRAFFVNRYQVASGLEILEQIRETKFHPMDVAFMLEDPGISVDPPTSEAKVEFIKYGIQDFELKVKATGNNLLFLSESWYPAGWKAFLDGKEIPVYRLNYMFRGVVVPKGEHRITMEFEPESFYIGKNITLITNLTTILALIFVFGVASLEKVLNKKYQGVQNST